MLKATPADLDIEQPKQLLAYLRARRAIRADEEPMIQILGGGVSNRVVLVRRATSEAWVLKQALPKLRVAVDWFSSPQRSHREAIALRWLDDLGVNVPAFRFEDDEHHLLAMDAVPEPHENWKMMLLAGDLEMGHVEAFGRMLAKLHYKSHAREAEVRKVFGDTSYFESLRIEPYYLYAASQVPQARAFMVELAESTRANRLCLVHGDYSPKNVLVHGPELVLLDHEVAHFGDPAFDVGFSMAHLLSKALHLPEHRDRFREASVRYWDTYWDQIGRQDWSHGLMERAVRSILSCLVARVAGRSPLEYLSAAERNRQLAATLPMMTKVPSSVPELVIQFTENL